MPRKTKETVIDGTSYRIKQFGAETGSDVLFRLGRGLAMSDLKPSDFTYVRDLLRDNTEVQIVDTKGDGRRTWVPLASSFDDHFSGRYKEMAEWLKFAFETNFGDFLGVVRDLVGSRADLSSFVPKGATGDSGDSSPANTSTSEASPS